MVDLSPEDRRHLGLRIDRARRNQGLSYVSLAQKTGYDERTIRNLVKGQSTKNSTLWDVCQALQIHVEEDDSARADLLVADDAHGNYAFTQCDDYIGHYYATRRSFTVKGSLVRSIFDIYWSEKRRCLCFKEYQRLKSEKSGKIVDYSQVGEIFVSKLSGLVHLQTLDDGGIRLITLTRLRTDDMTMNGLVLTQSPQSFYYKPSISPIFLQKTDASYTLEELTEQVRAITPADPEHAYADEYLSEIERNVGIFAIGSRRQTVSYIPGAIPLVQLTGGSPSPSERHEPQQ
ncbi:helix-turn-helix domain-containing protein [Rhizobium leguminosarum]|uniref:helix-turn-helix domain-containing protein n=1 Tax=Rhizobium leguminosarum TaxID=384 RepID=UPI003F950780